MTISICALCERRILPTGRFILLGIERVLVHGECYDDAIEDLEPCAPRERTVDVLRLAFQRARRA
jgi:hypothetical protein